MIKNRNRKRGRHDVDDLGDDDEDMDQGRAHMPDLKGDDSDEEAGGGWASDDENNGGATGDGRIGDDGSARLKDGKITSIEGTQ